jgi:hypothetical protein
MPDDTVPTPDTPDRSLTDSEYVAYSTGVDTLIALLGATAQQALRLWADDEAHARILALHLANELTELAYGNLDLAATWASRAHDAMWAYFDTDERYRKPAEPIDWQATER